MTSKVFSDQINLIGIHQRVYLKIIQWKSSIGKAQISIVASIFLRAEFHEHLQQYSEDITCGFIILI